LCPSSQYILVRLIPSCFRLCQISLLSRGSPRYWTSSWGSCTLPIWTGVNVSFRNSHMNTSEDTCLHMCKQPHEHILRQTRKEKRKKIYKNSLILLTSSRKVSVYLHNSSVHVVSHICLYPQMFTVYNIFL
jgi:hypothetical protein